MAKMVEGVVSQLSNIELVLKEGFASIGDQVFSNAKMLGALLEGEHGCPRWLVLLPMPDEVESNVARALEWTKPEKWLTKTVKLFFVCPLTRSPVGEGFEIKLPADWVVKYGPAIRAGITVLKVGTMVAKLAGLPIPNLADVMGPAWNTLEKQKEYLQTLANDIADELETNGLGAVNTWVRDGEARGTHRHVDSRNCGDRSDRRGVDPKELC